LVIPRWRAISISRSFGCRSHEPTIRCLTEEQAITLLALNGWRAAVQHYLLELSEQQLYIALQGAVTLFDDWGCRDLGARR
jgi:hypothetical protein